MAPRALYRRPSGEFEMVPDAATVIEAGDCLWSDGDDPKPASDFAYVTGDLAATQANFAGRFLGIAENSSAAGETRPIKIRSKGDIELNCAAAQFEVGDLVAMDDNVAGDALLSQQVIPNGANGFGAFGRIVRRYGANTTRVLVELLPPRHETPFPIELGPHTLGTADELVTDLALPFPVKLVELRAIVTTAIGTGDEGISIDKNATTLDDTMTLAASSPVGTVVRVPLDDATGDDIILVGDTISMATDGVSDAGVAQFTLLAKAWQLEV